VLRTTTYNYVRTFASARANLVHSPETVQSTVDKGFTHRSALRPETYYYVPGRYTRKKSAELSVLRTWLAK
jgi:hypothetical protein